MFYNIFFTIAYLKNSVLSVENLLICQKSVNFARFYKEAIRFVIHTNFTDISQQS